MKYALVTLALAVVATAQSLNDLPECSRSCIADAVGTSNCGSSDLTCICGLMDGAAQGPVSQCLIQACGLQAVIGQFLPTVKSICAAVPTEINSSPSPPLPVETSTSSVDVTTAVPEPVETTTEAAATLTSVTGDATTTVLLPAETTTKATTVISWSNASTVTEPVISTSSSEVVTFTTSPGTANTTSPGAATPTGNFPGAAGRVGTASVVGMLLAAALVL
ncbi:hypothetical protein B0I35DRAFT_482936 [Stachybotrys elegans]|uniref:CFEM domain-containing protein n=1 Tax=Stachybotrys elegans TaxID=80388 RepID=A0A8K0SDU3_9HYPO|nr:hypothetical protein B0I35DRAFT_482936 [Stachybotrys elegans]